MKHPNFLVKPICAAIFACATLATANLAWPQTTKTSNLAELTQSAWQRQVDYLIRDKQLAVIQAKQQLNARLLPESGAVDASTSRGNQGGRSFDLAYTIPLWLKNERSLSKQSLDAEALVLDVKLGASKLRISGQVRELYWAWLLAQNDVHYAKLHTGNATQLLGDVKKRLAGGDMTKADLTQAELAQLASQSALYEAQTHEQTMRAQLLAITGIMIDEMVVTSSAGGILNEEHVSVKDVLSIEKHPAMAYFDARIAQLSSSQQLQLLQTRARTELTIGAARERGGTGDSYQSSLRAGVKIPLDSAASRTIVTTTVASQLDELQVERTFESKRLLTEQSMAFARLKAFERQIELAQQRARAANDLLGMIQKAFAMGEFDLPTRIRTASEANEAQRLLSKVRIEKAAAASSYQQALGLLP